MCTKDDDIARRVRAAAEELNYSVNYAASSLRGAATNTIGLVIPSATDHFSAGLLDELEPVIDMERQQLLLGIGNEQHTQDERIESLVARKVDGIIIVPAAGVDLAHTLDRTTMTTPIVQVGGRQRSFRTSMVGIDENAAMESIVAHLAEQGVRSAAYLAGKEVSFESAEMFAMFHTQMRTHRLVTDTSWNRFGDSTVERGYQCVWRMFADSDARPPEAVICADDMIALGAMIALQTLGIRVPDDVRVVGYDDSPLALTTMPTLTSVRPPFLQIVTEALRRAQTTENSVLDYIPEGITLLPNTSGARNAEEAVRIARLAREVCHTDFVKVEIEHETKYLLPDNAETIRATEMLAKEGFVVMPYMFPDPIAARQLEEAGAAAVMPLGSLIGSNMGLRMRDFIEIIIANAHVPVIIDAGIGRPSQACDAMEMGADAVMAYTAVASAGNIPLMAEAFKHAIDAGRAAYLSGLGKVTEGQAVPSSPTTQSATS